MNITTAAIEWIMSQCTAAGHDRCVRVGVKEASSCGTHEYFFEYVNEINDDDTTSEYDDLRVVVDEASVKFLENATITLEVQGLNKGLNIVNEDEIAKCGCGKSVTLND
jgi:iron-sulfur cluster assembly protein